MKQPFVNRFPLDFEEFQEYISITDDEQKAIDTHGYTIYARKKDGGRDYDDKEKEQHIINQPMYHRWNWTTDESSQWSLFREEYNTLYKEHLASPSDQILKKELTDYINKCIAYDSEHRLVDRVADSFYAIKIQQDLFGIRQDELEYETPLRYISFRYEEQIPLNKTEKTYIKKYLTLHDNTYRMLQRAKKFRSDLEQISKTMPNLWEQIPALKNEADLATNTICLPPPNFKGAWSEVVSFKIPSAEENQKRAEDFNFHYASYHNELTVLDKKLDVLAKENAWALDISNGDEEDAYSKKLEDELDDMKSKLINSEGGSIDGCSLYEDYDGYLEQGWEQLTEECEKGADDWDKFCLEQNLLIAVYTAFINFIQEKFNGKDNSDEDQEPANINDINTDDHTDDLRAETIKKYKADLDNNTTTYFDVDDWHIILDDFNQKHDEKNMEMALQRALTQHTEHPVLLTRLARKEAEKHNFQKALDLIKQVEKQGPEQHPNLLWVKADIYLELEAPDLAIPLYKKLAAQKGEQLKWWRTHSYDNLVEIYDKQKNYDECIRLLKETMEERMEEGYLHSNLALYYSLNNNFAEAEKVVKDFLETHPESDTCWDRLAHIYTQTNRLEEAIECYDRSFVIDKAENYQSIYEKGKTLMQLEKYEEAIPCFELCILHFKLESKFYIGAAQCFEKLNIPHQASYHYKKALAVNPESKEALDAVQLLPKNNN